MQEPSVMDEARLRLQLMANHTMQQVRRDAQQVEAALHRAGAVAEGARRQALAEVYRG